MESTHHIHSKIYGKCKVFDMCAQCVYNMAFLVTLSSLCTSYIEYTFHCCAAALSEHTDTEMESTHHMHIQLQE